MSVTIKFLADVTAVRFSISYSTSKGKDHPDTLAEANLVKANIAAMGLVIKPHLTIIGSNPNGLFVNAYESADLSFLVRVHSFTSIEDIKAGVMKGFSEHVSTPYLSSANYMEYEFENESEKEITDWINTRSVAPKGIDDPVKEEPLSCSIL